MQAAVSGELLCPKNVSFVSEVEKPEGGSSASAPLHLYPPRACTHLPPALQCDGLQLY